MRMRALPFPFLAYFISLLFGMSSLTAHAKDLQEVLTWDSLVKMISSSMPSSEQIPLSFRLEAKKFADAAEAVDLPSFAAGMDVRVVKGQKIEVVFQVDSAMKNNPFALLEVLSSYGLLLNFVQGGGTELQVLNRDLFNPTPGFTKRSFDHSFDFLEFAMDLKFGSLRARSRVEHQNLSLAQVLSDRILNWDSNDRDTKSKALMDYLKFRGIDLTSLSKADGKSAVPTLEAMLEVWIRDQTERAEKIEKAARKHAQARRKIWESWKEESGRLDQLESLEKKLDHHIKDNNRKAVREILEAYLPWTLMDAMETLHWKSWLEALEHPDAKKTVTLFRGFDTKEIIFEGKKGRAFIPSLLSYNQGNYNRRLRSLVTTREKHGVPTSKSSFQDMESWQKQPLLSLQFDSHANDPRASPFISFSSSLDMATSFNVGGGVAAIQIDARRATPNPHGLQGEYEYLIPIVVFPDEVASFIEGKPSETDARTQMAKALGVTPSKLFDIARADAKDWGGRLARHYADMLSNHEEILSKAKTKGKLSGKSAPSCRVVFGSGS